MMNNMIEESRRKGSTAPIQEYYSMIRQAGNWPSLTLIPAN